jgi:hypothetical protein
MKQMYSTTTLFFTLSALVATSQGRPSAYDLSAPVAPVRAIFAGAPSDGRYPADMEDASGWSAEAYAPVHDVPTDAVVVSLFLSFSHFLIKRPWLIRWK